MTAELPARNGSVSVNCALSSLLTATEPLSNHSNARTASRSWTASRTEPPFSRRSEQTFRIQLPFQGFELRLKKSGAARLQDLDTELVLAACFEDRNVAVNLDLGSIGKGLPKRRHGVPKNHAGDLRALIFQREILVATWMKFVIGDFALHPNRAEFCFERAANATGQLCDGKNAGGLLKEVSCHLHLLICPRMTRMHTNVLVNFDSRLLA